MTSKQQIHLYPFQSEMVSRIAKSFETNRSVMVQMPTGTGKTHIGSYVWIIVPKSILRLIILHFVNVTT